MARKKNTEPKIGDNSHLTKDERKKLDGYVAEVFRIESERQLLATDVKGILESAKDANFSTKAIKRIVKEKLMTSEQKQAEQALQDLTDVYKNALGLLGGTVFEGAAKANTQVDLEEAIASSDEPKVAEPA